MPSEYFWIFLPYNNKFGHKRNQNHPLCFGWTGTNRELALLDYFGLEGMMLFEIWHKSRANTDWAFLKFHYKVDSSLFIIWPSELETLLISYEVNFTTCLVFPIHFQTVFLTFKLVNYIMKLYILCILISIFRLMDVLVDAREVLRNDALLLLIQLTKGHANLQKIVAFENAFDKLCDIIETVKSRKLHLFSYKVWKFGSCIADSYLIHPSRPQSQSNLQLFQFSLHCICRYFLS